jgi:LytS/YehU family sensor histidine kinase
VVDGYTYQEGYFYSSRYVVQLSAITLFITIFVGMLRFAVEWFRVEATKKEVENEKLQAELNFLKAQINPHFLFNTLNNLYYLAYTQSPNTTEVISKLSHVMRYMIDDARHAKVLLKKEIEYMENYISLERLRLNNQIPIDFSVEGEVGGLEVAPLVFITFLENAFKHGVSNNSTEAWVKILVKVTGHHVHYQVENSKLDTLHQPEDPRKGLGLANVKRRLELSYPGKHTLTIEDLPHRYAINLKIDLA